MLQEIEEELKKIAGLTKTGFILQAIQEKLKKHYNAYKINRSLEEEINEFLEMWDCKQQVAFLRDIIPLFELYDVNEEDDWVKEAVGEENERNIRLIRTVYLISKIAENHTGKLTLIKIKYPKLYRKMESTKESI